MCNKYFGLLKNIILCGLVFFTLWVYVSGFKYCFIDDAFILFKYAHNLFSYGIWGYFPDCIANTATSPLIVLLTGLFSCFIKDIPEAVVLLLTCELSCLLLFFILLSRRLFDSVVYGLICFLGVLFNPWLVSAMGIGGVLFTLLLVSIFYFYVTEQDILLGVSSALLTLVRPEGFLIFFVFLIFTSGIKRQIKVIVSYLMVVFPWVMFSWIKLGSFFPDTLIIKKHDASFPGISFYEGFFMYLYVYPFQSFASLFWLFLSFLGGRKKNKVKKKTFSVLSFSVCLHFVAYVLLDVPPYHWYYVPEIVLFIVLGSRGLYYFYEIITKKTAKKIALAGFVLLIISPMAFNYYSYGYPLTQMPIHTNHSSNNKYKSIAYWLNTNIDKDSVIVLYNVELGVLGYYSDAYLLNNFSYRYGLSNYLESENIFLKINYKWLKMHKSFDGKKQFFLCAQLDSSDHSSKLNVKKMIKSWDISSKWPTSVKNLVLYEK